MIAPASEAEIMQHIWGALAIIAGMGGVVVGLWLLAKAQWWWEGRRKRGKDC